MCFSEEKEVQQDGISSEVSAFTRIPPNAHKEEKGIVKKHKTSLKKNNFNLK